MGAPPSGDRISVVLLAVTLLAGVGCTGNILRRDPDEAIGSVQGAATAIPRLSRREIEAAIVDIFGTPGIAERILPEEAAVVINPVTSGDEEVFDTFIGTLGNYVPSEVFVQAVSTLASEVAHEVASDPTKVQALAGCAPAGDRDRSCMEQLVDGVGRRVYRRPLSEDERQRLLSNAMDFAADGGFPLGVRFVVQSLLESPDFIYRTEVGADRGDGLRKLDNHELVSRLAFHFWGAPPTPELLDLAAGAEFDESELSALASRMADDPRTTSQMRRFHQMWLRYEGLLVNEAALASDMLTETDALLERVLFDDAIPWSQLFTSEETYVSPALARHYGMNDVPPSAAWRSYENPERAGVLAHGSFLSLSSTQGEGTLPSRRGAILSRRILCVPILPPPPDVDIDDGVEVPPGTCKYEAYRAHREAGTACRGCHEQMDPLGFGFERFDGKGAYRVVERENAACAVEGAGSLAGSTFSGPREFAQLASESGDLLRCGTAQFLRFTLRRSLVSDDRSLEDRLRSDFVSSGEDFRTLMVALATDPAFRYRLEDDR